LGASGYLYVEVTGSQDLASWQGAHVNALDFYGGSPRVVVPDYVPGHIIGLLCPTRLCGRRDREGPFRSWNPACAAEIGHITQRV